MAENLPVKLYEQIPHTADLALKVYGPDLKGLFENAAFGMFDIILEKEGPVSGKKVKIEVSAPDEGTLLIDWLNELLYVYRETRSSLGGFSVNSVTSTWVSGTAFTGDKGETGEKKEIKAATYHDVKIRPSGDGLETIIIFDV